MKKSNMLIITAIVVLLGMSVTYNFSLKAAYKAGNYKNPFYGSDFQEIKNIETLNLTAANVMSVAVEPGQKEGVWLKKEIKDQVVLKHSGKTLTIGLSDKSGSVSRNFGPRSIVVVTNSLRKLGTASFWPEGTKNKDNYGYWSEVNLNGIKGENLELMIADYTYVNLDKVSLKKLLAVVGDGKGTASLSLEPDNQIESADFEVPGAGRVALNNPKVVKTRYNLSDKATVILNGAALDVIKNK